MTPDDLEIFIITYNRYNDLKKTLETITAENSPVRHCDIRILDNNSNDGTAELCRNFADRFSNVTHTKNHRNIGLSGNICRAMELADKKYFWILCDNDKIEFDAWNEVEQAMTDDYDLILASRFYFPEKYDCFEALVLNQLTFLPAGIYKTKFMTDDVMCYAMLDTYTILPHLALGCSIINHTGKIFLPSKSIVHIIPNVIDAPKGKYTFDRLKPTEHLLKNKNAFSINFYNGIAHSFDACENKKISKKAIDYFFNSDCINGYGPFLSKRGIVENLLFRKTSFSTFFSFFCCLSFLKKLSFMIEIIIRFSIGNLIYFYKNEKGINLEILNSIKIRIFSKAWLSSNFWRKQGKK